jgi:hypothetical protein
VENPQLLPWPTVLSCCRALPPVPLLFLLQELARATYSKELSISLKMFVFRNVVVRASSRHLSRSHCAKPLCVWGGGVSPRFAFGRIAYCAAVVTVFTPRRLQSGNRYLVIPWSLLPEGVRVTPSWIRRTLPNDGMNREACACLNHPPPPWCPHVASNCPVGRKRPVVDRFTPLAHPRL